MNILLDTLPHWVEINGHRYDINYDFRTGIKMDIVFHDERMTDQERYIEMCRLFYGKIENIYVEDVEKAVHKMLWFYTRGNYEQPTEKGGEQGKGQPPKKKQREYCFNQDADIINGAFLAVYNMKLSAIPLNGLHWWEFMSLFRALPPDTEIREYIYYRTCDLNKLSKTQQKVIREMRSKIRIRSEVKDADMTPAARLEKRNREWLKHARIIAQSVGREDTD